MGANGCLHGLVPKTKRKGSERFLGSVPDSQLSEGEVSHLETPRPPHPGLVHRGPPILCLEGGADASLPAEQRLVQPGQGGALSVNAGKADTGSTRSPCSVG